MTHKPLNIIPVGEKFRIGDTLCQVSLTRNGCKGCLFEKDAGARDCELSAFCMGHIRPDKQSVKFIELK